MESKERMAFDAKLEGLDRAYRGKTPALRPGVVDPYMIAPNNVEAMRAMMAGLQ